MAFVLAAAVLVSGSKIAAAAGAGFAVAALGGYLLVAWPEAPLWANDAVSAEVSRRMTSSQGDDGGNSRH